MANQNINMVFGIQGHDVIARGMNQIETSVKKSTNQVDKMIKSLQDEYAQMTKSTQQLQVRKAALEGASKAQIDGIIALQKAITAKQEEAAEIAKANAAREKEQAEYAQSQQAIQRIVNQLKEEHKLLGLTKDEIQLKKAAMAGATQAQLQEIAALQKSIKAKQVNSKETGILNKQLRFMRGGFGQVGHQIQDVSVQLQMGTDAMLVFGQQGSQIASLFGGGGAMIGALISVGAAISTYISASSLQAAKDLKSMEDEFISAAKAAGVMTDGLQDFLRADLESSIKKKEKELEQLNKQLNQNNKTTQEANNATKAFTGATKAFGASAGAAGLALAYYTSGQEEAEVAVDQHAFKASQLEKELNKLKGQLDEVNKGNALGKTKTDESIESIREEIAVLQMQYDKQISAAQAQAIYNAMQDEELQNNPMLLEDRLHKIRTLFAEKKALEELVNPQDDVNESNREGATDAQKFALKVATMTEQLGLSRIELLRLQATHAANGDSALLEGFMAAIDAYVAKQKQIADKSGQENDIFSAFGDFESEMKAMEDRLDGVRDYLKTDEELFREFYEDKQNTLDDSLNNLLISQEEYNKLSTKLDEDRLAALKVMQDAEAMGRMQMMSAVLSSAQQSLSQMSQVFDESTALGKAFYVAQQTIAASQAIINGYLTGAALKKNWALMGDIGIAGTTAENAAIAMGYASAGAIMGQTLASFEGGGITFSGVRSGGLDGKGGRLAVVHSNEKITDLEKDGSTGQPVNVQFTINAVDAKGIDQLLYERRGMITGIVQKAVNNVGRRIM